MSIAERDDIQGKGHVRCVWGASNNLALNYQLHGKI